MYSPLFFQFSFLKKHFLAKKPMAGYFPAISCFNSNYLTALPALKLARTCARSLSDIEIKPALSQA